MLALILHLVRYGSADGVVRLWGRGDMGLFEYTCLFILCSLAKGSSAVRGDKGAFKEQTALLGPFKEQTALLIW